MSNSLARLANDPGAIETIEYLGEVVVAEKNPVHVYLAARQSERSRETMTESLKRISKLLKGGGIEAVDWKNFSFAHAGAIRAALLRAKTREGTSYGPATVNITLAALRGVLETAMNLDLLTYETYRRASSALKSVKGSRLPPGRDLSTEEIAKLRSYCTSISGPYGSMLRGILAVLLGGGLRREEACLLRIDNYQRPCLRVVGKGNKQRLVTLSNEALSDLESWLETRNTLDISIPHMFIRLTKDGRGRMQPFSVDGLYNLVRELGIDSGIGEISTHDFRRTCATRQLDNGVDIMIVQRNLGHESSKTTEKYDRRAEKEAKRAIDKAGVY